METLWKVFKWLLALLSIAVASVIVLFVWESSGTPRYDDEDPRYAGLAQQLSKSRQDFGNGNYSRNELDLSSLENGNWTTACVFGGYNDPLGQMLTLGKVSDEDRNRLLELRKIGFRLTQVEEFEVMIGYVDYSGNAHFVHFQHGFGPDGQHFKRCISKPETSVKLV